MLTPYLGLPASRTMRNKDWCINHLVYEIFAIAEMTDSAKSILTEKMNEF